MCSDCGLCDSYLQPAMAQACVFVRNQTEALEHGCTGAIATPMTSASLEFSGATRSATAPPQSQGAVDGYRNGARSAAARTGRVEAVLTTGAGGHAVSSAAGAGATPAEVLATAGNKPSLSPVLNLLDAVREQALNA
ncbi:hypothetical protein [Chromatium okenii]|uniref:hypothetical protein n=1 Tax=Chromatium okenii TaxID=61644 RepID=UPI003D6B3CFA